MKHGIPLAKNKVVLTPKNLLERCACFLKYKIKNSLDQVFQGFFSNAMSTYLHPRCTMDSTLHMWKDRFHLSRYHVEMYYGKSLLLMFEDVYQIFFLYTSLGSQL